MIRSLAILLLTSLFLFHSVESFAAEQVAQPTAKAPADITPFQNTGPAMNMGEDPGPLYTRLVKEWMDTTHFAQNTAELAVGKLQLDMQNDPELQKIMSKNLIADLQQYYYEVFVSTETIQALARVYAQYFTLEEMQALIEFYRTPLGQKWIKANPDISLKTQRIAIDLLKKNEKGYLKIITKYTNPSKERK